MVGLLTSDSDCRADQYTQCRLPVVTFISHKVVLEQVNHPQVVFNGKVMSVPQWFNIRQQKQM